MCVWNLAVRGNRSIGSRRHYDNKRLLNFQSIFIAPLLALSEEVNQAVNRDHIFHATMYNDSMRLNVLQEVHTYIHTESPHAISYMG